MKSELTLLAITLFCTAALVVPAVAETYEYEDLTVTESASYSGAEFSVTGTLTLDNTSDDDAEVTLTFSENSAVTVNNLTSVITTSESTYSGTAEISLYDSSLTVTGTTYPTETASDGNATVINCENSSVTLNDVTITAGNMWIVGDSNSTLEITGTLYLDSSDNDNGGIASAALFNSYTNSYTVSYYFSAYLGTITLSDVVVNSGSLTIYADTIILTGSVTVADSLWPAFECEELIIVISEDTYATSDYAVSGTIFCGGNIDAITLSIDEEFLAEIIAGTATEYNLQIFDETAQYWADLIDGMTLAFDDSWNIDGYEVSFEDGVVTVVAIPEPSTFGFLAGIAVLAFTASRRSRHRSRKIA